MRFGDSRVQALAGALAVTLCTVTGITNRSLRALMTGLLGAPYSMAQASYDLARLRRNGLITRRPHANTYDLTPDGLAFAIFYTKVHDRVLAPLFTAGQPQAPPQLRAALRTIEHHIDERLANPGCLRQPDKLGSTVEVTDLQRVARSRLAGRSLNVRGALAIAEPCRHPFGTGPHTLRRGRDQRSPGRPASSARRPAPLSTEHVVPKWVRKALQIGEPVKEYSGITYVGAAETLRSYSTRCVSGATPGGWRRWNSVTRPVLEPLLLGAAPGTLARAGPGRAGHGRHLGGEDGIAAGPQQVPGNRTTAGSRSALCSGCASTTRPALPSPGTRVWMSGLSTSYIPASVQAACLYDADRGPPPSSSLSPSAASLFQVFAPGSKTLISRRTSRPGRRPSARTRRHCYKSPRPAHRTGGHPGRVQRRGPGRTGRTYCAKACRGRPWMRLRA